MQRVRNRFFFFIDLVLLPLATYLAYVARFEGTQWPAEAQIALIGYLLATVPIKLLVLYGAGLYRRLWRYATVSDLELIIGACTVSTSRVEDPPCRNNAF